MLVFPGRVAVAAAAIPQWILLLLFRRRDGVGSGAVGEQGRLYRGWLAGEVFDDDGGLGWRWSSLAISSVVLWRRCSVAACSGSGCVGGWCAAPVALSVGDGEEELGLEGSGGFPRPRSPTSMALSAAAAFYGGL